MQAKLPQDHIHGMWKVHLHAVAKLRYPHSYKDYILQKIHVCQPERGFIITLLVYRSLLRVAASYGSRGAAVKEFGREIPGPLLWLLLDHLFGQKPKPGSHGKCSCHVSLCV